jgi:hypothetical protein
MDVGSAKWFKKNMFPVIYRSSPPPPNTGGGGRGRKMQQPDNCGLSLCNLTGISVRPSGGTTLFFNYVIFRVWAGLSLVA